MIKSGKAITLEADDIGKIFTIHDVSFISCNDFGIEAVIDVRFIDDAFRKTYHIDEYVKCSASMFAFQDDSEVDGCLFQIIECGSDDGNFIFSTWNDDCHDIGHNNILIDNQVAYLLDAYATVQFYKKLGLNLSRLFCSREYPIYTPLEDVKELTAEKQWEFVPVWMIVNNDGVLSGNKITDTKKIKFPMFQLKR